MKSIQHQRALRQRFDEARATYHARLVDRSAAMRSRDDQAIRDTHIAAHEAFLVSERLDHEMLGQRAVAYTL